jgi:XTP/dITP diphosphohydrolase
MKMVFASHNTGKVRELQQIFSKDTIIPAAELQVSDIEETGLTFVENALLKARNASLQTGLPAIADDSGLMVDALSGAPGLYSARFAGKKASAKENIHKLLKALEDVPADRRQAHFYCCLVFLAHPSDPTPLIAEARWSGVILTEEKGHEGFGYDPIFFDPEENMTAAECPLPRKNEISHRGKALKQLFKQLSETAPCTHSQ